MTLIKVNDFLHTLLLLPATAAAASVAAAHLLLVLFYGVGAVQVVVFNLAVDRHAGRSTSSLGFETAIRVLGTVPIVRALQRHGVDDHCAGVIIRAQLGSGNADAAVRVIQRQIHDFQNWGYDEQKSREGRHFVNLQFLVQSEDLSIS